MAHLTAGPINRQDNTLQATGPPPGTVPHPTVTGPPRRRPSRVFWIVAAAVVAVIAMVAGVALWVVLANRAPAAPTGLKATATAMSVELTWAPGEDSVTTLAAEEFAVLRDGDVVGTVPASQTSFVDEDMDLAPGVEYDYQVVARTESQASEPSDHVLVTMQTPSPVDLGAGESTPEAVSLHWSRPPDSRLPDAYIVVRDGEELSPLPGVTESYTEDGLKPDTVVDFQVIAVWGDARSAPSETLTVSTLKWAAPLQGTWTVDFKTTTTPGSGASGKVGDTWTDTWTVTPKCAGSDCNVTVKGSVSSGPGYEPVPFTATLKRSGNAYTGSTKAKFSYCGDTLTTDTLKFRLTREKVASSGLWSAWSGTLAVNSPYTSISSTRYCPAQSWTYSLTSSG